MRKTMKSWSGSSRVGRWALVVAAAFMATGAVAAGQLAEGEGAAGGSFRDEDGQEAFTWRGSMPDGGALEIKGVNGSVQAVRAAGSDVVVTATLRGRRSDPATVRVERVEHAGGITFCAVYPTPDGSDRENVCAPGDEGRMSTSRNDVQVEFRVEVPAGVPFHGRTVNGSVEATDLASDIMAVTVNGSVEVSTTGTAAARSVNGSLDVQMGTAPTVDAEFETVNGRILLDVPDDVNARVEARWLNGGLDADLPMRLGSMSRGRASATLGQGGPIIHLKTVNGSIRIR